MCGACSTKRFLLPQQSSKPLRVCNKCYSQLTNEENGPRDIAKSPSGSGNLSAVDQTVKIYAMHQELGSSVLISESLPLFLQKMCILAFKLLEQANALRFLN